MALPMETVRRMPGMRLHRRPMTLVALLVLAVVGAACDDGGDETSTTSSSVAPADTGDADPTTTTFDGTRVEVEVRDGEVAGGVRRVEVDTGERVLLVVTSDVADEVHVHGVDITGEVEAGGTVGVDFTADIPGVFEIELEAQGLQLVELVVGA